MIRSSPSGTWATDWFVGPENERFSGQSLQAAHTILASAASWLSIVALTVSSAKTFEQRCRYLACRLGRADGQYPTAELTACITVFCRHAGKPRESLRRYAHLMLLVADCGRTNRERRGQELSSRPLTPQTQIEAFHFDTQLQHLSPLKTCSAYECFG